MSAANKLLIISSIILTIISIIFLTLDYIAYYFIASHPAILFLLLIIRRYLWVYFLFSIAILIVGIVARKKEGYAIGGVALGITAITLIYNLWFIIVILVPVLVAVPPLMSMVIIITFVTITILIIIGLVGGILKLVHGGKSGA